MLRRSNLRGFRIPGVLEKVVTSLFADDTTVYLTKHDTFTELNNTLQRWCKASTAKFNVEKTEVLPIGTKEYRKRVLETRKLNDNQEELPSDVHIVRDGEPMRSLGVWIGNDVHQVAVWSKQTEKVEGGVDQWEMSGPTLIGRRLIASLMAGQITQYLTMVQGMPPAVEAAIDKICRNMFWEHKKPLIAASTIQDDPERGGVKLIDIKARNAAIDVEWSEWAYGLGRTTP
ncbi:hypothetical protein K525DRAFT_291920 [Schizophyllum commune Loenen D]|nr:hypothetical protein K525DRAFT_291920 [Schizophyllum commune Loenen D]